MKSSLIYTLMILVNLLVALSDTQAQIEPLVLGELVFGTFNRPTQYELRITVSNVGMLFSGDSDRQCPQPRIYAHTYTNLDGNCSVLATQSITGASQTLSNTNGRTEWDLEHIGDAGPRPYDPNTGNYQWLGYGLYEIEIIQLQPTPVNTYVFYLDYLDSNYPSLYYPSSVDIHVNYYFDRPSGNRIILKPGNQPDLTNVNGKTYAVWSLFGQETRATDFFLHGTVPFSGLSSDALFTSVIVDGDVTVPSGKSFVIQPSAYPDPQSLASIALYAQSGKKLTVNGTLTADNATFTATGGATWKGLYFASGSGGTQHRPRGASEQSVVVKRET